MIGFIGVGNMARAILKGTVQSGMVQEKAVGLFDANPAQYSAFPAARTYGNVRELVAEERIVFFAVKPQVLPAVLAELDGVDVEGKIFVSICAAVAMSFIQKALPGAHVVRAMPNTPMLYGKGVCALSRSENVTDAEFEEVHALFSVLGTTVVLEEKLQNDIIAVTGSSPAYLFKLADAMAQAAQESGFDYGESVNWIADVFEGAAVMLRKSGFTPKQLCDMVCSPGGTTLEAMHVFEESDFTNTVKKAMQACTKRAQVLQKD
ncbi:MAG: pyrroline-5-carboxylate reductase [Clostridia bacterium]|nr:pyrroline-5-carboxylate reductase [Clostridia bacterium]